MENAVNGDQTNANQGTPAGDAPQGAADPQPQDSQNGGAPQDSQQGDQGQPGGENPNGDQPHETHVPYERFKQVNDKLSEFTSLIESAKTDPAARAQLAEMLGVAKQPDQAAQPETTPFQEFLQKSVDPQMHAHYDSFARAISAELESYVAEQLAPIMAYIGKSSLDGAFTKNPLLKDHQTELADVMKKHPTLTPDEAGWHIPALREKLIKQAAMSGQKQEQQRQNQINKTPVTKTNGAPGGTPQPGPKTVRGMVEQAFSKIQSPVA